MIKFCTYNPTSNLDNYLWNVVLQPSCKVVNTLRKMPQPCDNLVTTLQGCSKVATTSKFPYGTLSNNSSSSGTDGNSRNSNNSDGDDHGYAGIIAAVLVVLCIAGI